MNKTKVRFLYIFKCVLSNKCNELNTLSNSAEKFIAFSRGSKRSQEC